MAYTIANDRLLIDGKPVRFVPATASGSRMLPELIVVHDTAGHIHSGSSVDWFSDPNCKTSAHVCIERDGTIVQMVPFDHKCWHAGESSFEGRRYCNSFSIGIEMVGPGALKPGGPGLAKAWFHKSGEGYAIDHYSIVQRSTPEHGSAMWMPYTPAQIDAVTKLCVALIEVYPAIKAVTGHYVISPKRKVDPSPLFPLAELSASLFGQQTAPKTDNVSRETSGDARPVSRPIKIGDHGEDVRAAQERLKDLGYAVGGIDGRFGPLLRVAVLAYEAENGLATDGVLDAADCELLFRIDVVASQAVGSAANSPTLPKSIPNGAREEATLADLRASGSQTVASSDKLTWLGVAVAGGGLADGVGNVSGLVSQAETLSGLTQRVTAIVPPWLTGKQLICIGAVTVGVYVAWQGWQIAQRRLEDHRTGAHKGR